MKTPSMPGFTAEASLSNTVGRYRLLGTPDPYASHGKIVPQVRRCYWECHAGDCGWYCYGTPEM
jgi:hypothetical protein